MTTASEALTPEPTPATPPASRLRVAASLARYQGRSDLDQQGYSSEQFGEVNRVLNLLGACSTGKLGSHVCHCANCSRDHLGLNHCGNRHCPTCGYRRRTQWRDDLLTWTLDGDYWHNVFTLPHELNPLMSSNPRVMYKLLLRCVCDTLRDVLAKQLDCEPGLVMTLHTWGQRLNQHVHVHVVMTGGGQSLDGLRWVLIPRDHPAMQAWKLAADFKRKFLRRLVYLLRRDACLWPEAACESNGTMGPQPTSIERLRTRPLPRTPLRELIDQERSLIAVVKAKSWIVDCQATPPEYQGGEAIVNYLAAYVAGAAIGDGRMLSDDGTDVTFRLKDYKAGTKTTKTVTGPEFVRLFASHILPSRMQRVRYRGLFQAKGREERLQVCRALIAAAQGRSPPMSDEDDSQSQQAAAPNQSSDPLDTDEPEEPQRPPETTKRCRYCQGATTVVGVLSGNQTLRLQALVRVIVGLFALLPVLAAQLIQELIEQVRSEKPDYRGLPPEIANNLTRQPLVELEPAAFIALLHAQLAPPRIAA